MIGGQGVGTLDYGQRRKGAERELILILILRGGGKRGTAVEHVPLVDDAEENVTINWSMKREDTV